MWYITDTPSCETTRSFHEEWFCQCQRNWSNIHKHIFISIRISGSMISLACIYHLYSASREICTWFAFCCMLLVRTQLQFGNHLSRYRDLWDRLIFIMEIIILVRGHLYIETNPECRWVLLMCFNVTQLAMGQSCDSSNASEATLKNAGKYISHIHQEVFIKPQPNPNKTKPWTYCMGYKPYTKKWKQWKTCTQ